MNNTKNINDYVNVRTQKDNTDTYNIFKITKDNLDRTTSPFVKSAFVKYFSEKKNTQQGYVINVLDLSQVMNIDHEGIPTILMANRLSYNSNEGYLSIIGCNTAVKRALQISQIDTVLNIANQVEDLYRIPISRP